jgi:hypothetical protein
MQPSGCACYRFESSRDVLWCSGDRSDQKMLSHPPGQRSAHSGSPPDSEEIGKISLTALQCGIRYCVVSATARVTDTAAHSQILLKTADAVIWRKPKRPITKNPLSMAGLRQTLLQGNLERAKGLEPSTPTLARSERPAFLFFRWITHHYLWLINNGFFVCSGLRTLYQDLPRLLPGASPRFPALCRRMSGHE